MKGRIVKAFLTIISFLLVSEIYFLVIHFVVTEKYQGIADNLVSEYELSKDTSELVNSFYDLIQYSNDEKRVQIYRNNLAKLQALLAKLDNNLVNNDSWTVYQGVKNTINVVIGESNKGIEDISAGNFSEVTANYLKAAQDNNFVKENTGSLLLKELENVKVLQGEIAKTKFWSELIGFILCLAAIVGSLLYANFCANKMVVPMLRLSESVKKISAGKYDEKIDVDLMVGKNEMADLVRSIDSIRLTLKENIKKTKADEPRLAEKEKMAADDKEDQV
jgi:methyl-accepting chemotaxis protein